jgi:hypothetical protein
VVFADEETVLQGGLPSIGPVLDMMSVAVPGFAAWKAASLIPDLQRPA